jgi:hypothetical protein
MALVVLLVGVIMSAILIDMGYSFSTITRQQRNFYADHVAAADYVQAAKGWLIQDNINRGTVWHGQGLSSRDSPVSSVSDLLLDDPHVSYDLDVAPHGVGRQRVVVNVFDVQYQLSHLGSALQNDYEQMRVLPAPINAVGGSSTSAGEGMESQLGGPTTGDIGTKEESGGRFYPWDRFGAYVVRVQLFNVSAGGSVLTRTAEEAFFQLLSDDI